MYESQILIDVDRNADGTWELVARFGPSDCIVAVTDIPDTELSATLRDMAPAIAAAIREDEDGPQS